MIFCFLSFVLMSHLDCHDVAGRNVLHFDHMPARARAELAYGRQIIHGRFDSLVVYVQVVGIR